MGYMRHCPEKITTLNYFKRAGRKDFEFFKKLYLFIYYVHSVLPICMPEGQKRACLQKWGPVVSLWRAWIVWEFP